MKGQFLISHVVAKWVIATCLLTIVSTIQAQVIVGADTLKIEMEGTLVTDDTPLGDIIDINDTIATDGTVIFATPTADSVLHKGKRDWSTWRPDPKREPLIICFQWQPNNLESRSPVPFLRGLLLSLHRRQ